MKKQIVGLSAVFSVAAVVLGVCVGSYLNDAMKAFCFPIISIAANMTLLIAVFAVLKVAKIHFERWQIAAIVCTYVLFALLTFCTVSGRSFIYYWDYSNYIVKQINVEAAFKLGIKAGISSIIRTFYDDYTNFINIFTEFPFCLTSRSGDAYLYCQLVNVFIPVLILISSLIEKIGKLVAVPHKKLYFLCSLAVLTAFPPLRYAYLLGQPDWFGLVFSISIVLLTIDYDFAEIDYLRGILILAATAALIFTRRWYLYFVLTYYIAYGTSVLCHGLRLRKSNSSYAKKIFKNAILYAAFCAIFLVILFFPMIRHIMGYNYGERYAFYKWGGFLSELRSQFFKLDMFLWLLLGFVLLKKKFSPRKRFWQLAAIHICSLLLAIAMFTRVQNINQHHELMLIPYYFMIFLLAIASAMFIEGKRYQRICAGLCAASCLYSASILVTDLGEVYAPVYVYEKLYHTENVYLSNYAKERIGGMYRGDLGQINTLVSWIETHTTEDETVYFIPHNKCYNPDILINSRLPDQSLRSKIAFGFDVPGTHPFPVSLFDAKYVITAVPFSWSTLDRLSSNNLAPKLNELFLSLADERFRFVESIDMGNQYTMQIYERIIPADAEELSVYLEAFAEFDAQFPDLYSEVIANWAWQHNIEVNR